MVSAGLFLLPILQPGTVLTYSYYWVQITGSARMSHNSAMRLKEILGHCLLDDTSMSSSVFGICHQFELIVVGLTLTPKSQETKNTEDSISHAISHLVQMNPSNEFFYYEPSWLDIVSLTEVGMDTLVHHAPDYPETKLTFAANFVSAFSIAFEQVFHEHHVGVAAIEIDHLVPATRGKSSTVRMHYSLSRYRRGKVDHGKVICDITADTFCRRPAISRTNEAVNSACERYGYKCSQGLVGYREVRILDRLDMITDELIKRKFEYLTRMTPSVGLNASAGLRSLSRLEVESESESGRSTLDRMRKKVIKQD